MIEKIQNKQKGNEIQFVLNIEKTGVWLEDRSNPDKIHYNIYNFEKFSLEDLMLITQEFVEKETTGMINGNAYYPQDAKDRLSNILNKPKLLNASKNDKALTAVINNTLTAQKIKDIAALQTDEERIDALKKIAENNILRKTKNFYDKICKNI